MDVNLVQALALGSEAALSGIGQVQRARLEELLAHAGGAADEVARAIRAFVPEGSSAVVGVFADNDIWASLIVAVDNSGAPAPVGTLEGFASELRGGMAKAAADAVRRVDADFRPCALGLFLDKPHAETLLSASDKAAVIRAASMAGKLILSPVPPALAVALA
ncbi:hypothetical protein KIH31_06555 [Paenarthrobacter sp. DKR-5]|uniref:hypothetical protein n=1 Tax=Paenarthrobacter sp. DKR-5 TaxID=2835535 RepID=UPI001BDBC663|nr:hypothetical protein [Paenarthrobacter sp. DKR-5]MBT1002258.1 hypothetical protein [Paenarthrobacter sp. DKR-5]